MRWDPLGPQFFLRVHFSFISFRVLITIRNDSIHGMRDSFNKCVIALLLLTRKGDRSDEIHRQTENFQLVFLVSVFIFTIFITPNDYAWARTTWSLSKTFYIQSVSWRRWFVRWCDCGQFSVQMMVIRNDNKTTTTKITMLEQQQSKWKIFFIFMGL